MSDLKIEWPKHDEGDAAVIRVQKPTGILVETPPGLERDDETPRQVVFVKLPKP